MGGNEPVFASFAEAQEKQMKSNMDRKISRFFLFMVLFYHDARLEAIIFKK